MKRFWISLRTSPGPTGTAKRIASGVRAFMALVLLLGGGVFSASAAIPPFSVSPTTVPQKQQLSVKLKEIRESVIRLQKELIDSLKTQQSARSQIQKIQTLLKLQTKERDLGQKRLSELENTVGQLEQRRGQLREKILVQQRKMRRGLREIEHSLRNGKPGGVDLFLSDSESMEGPRRRLMAGLVSRGVREIETLRVDLDDSNKLEARIQEEKQQLTYLFQDLSEQQSLLELNRQLQVDLLRKEYRERLAQLESYRKLKSAESQVEQLITEFNSRRELEKMVEQDRNTSRAEKLIEGQMASSAFARLKGRLALPVDGKVVSTFGRSFDTSSRLYVFKKGIDILASGRAPVRAVHAGKVAFSGELPKYGRVTIVDHGEHFYSLCGNLGELSKKAGDEVKGGEVVGLSDSQGTPVYFEIRARNIAVNPLQWVLN